ncbi:MAG TPA: hypothetical protein VEK13_02005 [Thermoplasmata archaeon]|nr:hypothetical protein [Thermoplasmata archaeon]
MLSFADIRTFGHSDERFSRCLVCGRTLILLPDDRREGCCFDCLTLSIAAPMPCPECGTMIPGEERGVGCSNCRWYPPQD